MYNQNISKMEGSILKDQSTPGSLYSRLPLRMREAFLACLILGFLTHLFAFTNIIPNSDGLSRVFDTQQMTVSGRWFLHYASWFHGFLQAPALIGVLSLIFLGTAAGLTVDALGIRGRMGAVLCGAVMAMFPSVAYMNLYIFTASAYAFGILLAALSVWLFRKRPRLLPVASLCLACAMGTYQAYAAVAIALALGCVLMDLLDDERPLNVTVRSGLGVLGMLALGAVLYYLILQLFLWVKDLTLLSYLGMDSFRFSDIPGKLLGTYWNFFRYFLVPDSCGYNSTAMVVIHWVLLAVALLGGLALLLDRKLWKEPLRPILLLVGIALLPLACNFAELLSDSTPLMRYGCVYVYVIAIGVLDRAPVVSLRRGFCAAMAVALLLFAQTCNLAYTASETAHRATLTFATNLVGRVESVPGYVNGMEVVIVGAYPQDVYPSGVEAFQAVSHHSCVPNTVITLNKHIYYYLNDWINVPWPEPSEEVFQSVANSEEFQSMPRYPSDGSVQILDGRVVVKLSETYTPRKPYEIAYENRR